MFTLGWITCASTCLGQSQGGKPGQGGESSPSARNQSGSAQTADSSFNPVVKNPAFKNQSGPLVVIDEAHYNFHTVDGRYAPFAKLLRLDGFRVEAGKLPFTKQSLSQTDVLVIANALAQENQTHWQLPTPSAFSGVEIKAVKQFVQQGGSLLLIADHMPFPGAAESMAKSFEVEWLNGFAMPDEGTSPLRFDADHGLRQHSIVQGRNESERVKWVGTFTGSAFRVPRDFEPLLVFGSGITSRQPETAWQFNEGTPSVQVENWCQGAVRKFGKGRVAIFGEAAMFSAQESRGARMFGMNHSEAPYNAQFLLNTMHWLVGELDQ